MTQQLSPDHLKTHIEGSGIALDIARERGYQTLTRPEDVEVLGFADFQAATARPAPVLAIPLWNVTGQTPPRPPFHQCIIKAVGFFAVEKPIKPSKTTMSFPGRPRKASRLNDA